MRAHRGIAATLVGLLVGISTAFIATTPAAALDGADFDPEYIISDAQFYDSDAMTEAEIQAFLNGKVSVCDPGYTCLKDYTTGTFTIPGDPMCNTYNGGGVESAARIIKKVAVACGISPRVLLVMLQKEQGLITDTWPLASQYEKAMGAGCPDTAPCDPAHAGFFRQVHSAAWFLKRYGGPPGTGPGTNWPSDYSQYGPGKPVAVLYHPNRACGTRTLVIRNQPTSSLYTYTPYQPNAAALANLWRTGDACSSYGNRNFWAFYSIWFGDPQSGLDGVTMARIGGADRFEVATAISRRSYPDPSVVSTVYVTNGHNFPDALTAAPAASRASAPLLLVSPDAVPQTVITELRRLAPDRIVVVGGVNSVSDAVLAQLRTMVADVQRVDGVDRYEASRNLLEASFPGAIPRLYVVTGANFPDALSASSAAGAQGSPVLLVNGSAPLDDATRALLQSHAISRITIAGGVNSVSAELQSQLATIAPTDRLDGADRFAVARAVVADSRPTATVAYLADGMNFPDALAGAVLASKEKAALFVTPGWCVPTATIDAIRGLGVTQVTLIGGPASLSPSVRYFMPC